MRIDAQKVIVNLGISDAVRVGKIASAAICVEKYHTRFCRP
jgi:hypothetical protein